jgi:PTH1 family peptidyl-tRNA hydrolase
MLLDHIARSLSVSFSASKFDYSYSESSFSQSDFVLVKPAAYVNNSGVAAYQATSYFKAAINDILVIVDDINLSLASFRVRSSGGDGGHNGVNSIINHLASDQFPRIRIGVGNNFEKGAMAQYVLQDFNKNEINQLTDTFNTCELLVKEFITGGITSMLNLNSRL